MLGSVIYNVRRAQGRSAELIPPLEELVESEPTVPVWRIALDAESCEFIYSTLAPFAGTMSFTGASITDANDVARACLADHLGRHAIADDHFQDDGYVAWSARLLERIT